MHDVHHLLKIYDANGNYLKDIPLPAIGTTGGISGHKNDPEMFFAFASYLFPYTSYRYDFDTTKAKVYQKPEIDFDSDKYKTTQVFYKSKDGTKIPMYIISKKDIKLDTNNPTLLYGYGGFNISLRPGFSIRIISWLDLGGIYAVANLRGGNEYGEAWHQQGILGNKQNVFDDFIAAAQYLINNKYTCPEKLAIQGGSNGGLLTAACSIQHPELFGAVACHVPVTDMLRYHKFTVGRYWVSDYGNAEEDPEAFKYLYKYSPLHNVPENYNNPSILVTSADTDDRVVPAHAKKLVAAMQAKSSKKKPILLRVETKAGHGHGKPTSKKIDELTDVFAFLYKSLNMGN
jgi:prolyl oligopeptidase